MKVSRKVERIEIALSELLSEYGAHAVELCAEDEFTEKVVTEILEQNFGFELVDTDRSGIYFEKGPTRIRVLGPSLGHWFEGCKGKLLTDNLYLESVGW